MGAWARNFLKRGNGETGKKNKTVIARSIEGNESDAAISKYKITQI